MNFNLLNMNFRTQANMLLPPMLRSTTMVDFLGSLLSPLTSLLLTDKDTITEIAIRAQWTGQKMVMQEALNYVFGITVAPFIIIETVQSGNVTLYAFDSEEDTDVEYVWKDGGVSTAYAYSEGEADTPLGYDFLVKMPVGIATAENLALLAQQVDLIKVAGKTYSIITY